MAIPAFLMPIAVKLAAEVVPSLAGKILGKRGAKVAEKVWDTALDVAGVDPDVANADPELVLAQVRQDQEVANALRIQLQTLDAEEHQREIDDRNSARQYQLALGSEGQKRGTMMVKWAAGGLLLCVCAVVGGSLYAPEAINEAEVAFISTVAGALLKMLSDAFAFEFGSSRGSKEKSAQIDEFSTQLKEVGLARIEQARTAPPATRRADRPAEPRPFVEELQRS